MLHKIIGTWENNNNMSKFPLHLGQNLTLFHSHAMLKPHNCRLNRQAQSANPTVKSHPKSATKNPKPSGGLTLHGAKHVQCKWKMVYSCCLGLSIYQKEDQEITEISSNLSSRNLGGSLILLTYHSKSLNYANKTTKTLFYYALLVPVDQQK